MRATFVCSNVLLCGGTFQPSNGWAPKPLSPTSTSDIGFQFYCTRYIIRSTLSATRNKKPSSINGHDDIRITVSSLSFPTDNVQTRMFAIHSHPRIKGAKAQKNQARWNPIHHSTSSTPHQQSSIHHDCSSVVSHTMPKKIYR